MWPPWSSHVREPTRCGEMVGNRGAMVVSILYPFLIVPLSSHARAIRGGTSLVRYTYDCQLQPQCVSRVRSRESGAQRGCTDTKNDPHVSSIYRTMNCHLVIPLHLSVAMHTVLWRHADTLGCCC